MRAHLQRAGGRGGVRLRAPQVGVQPGGPQPGCVDMGRAPAGSRAAWRAWAAATCDAPPVALPCPPRRCLARRPSRPRTMYQPDISLTLCHSFSQQRLPGDRRRRRLLGLLRRGVRRLRHPGALLLLPHAPLRSVACLCDPPVHHDVAAAAIRAPPARRPARRGVPSWSLTGPAPALPALLSVHCRCTRRPRAPLTPARPCTLTASSCAPVRGRGRSCSICWLDGCTLHIHRLLLAVAGVCCVCALWGVRRQRPLPRSQQDQTRLSRTHLPPPHARCAGTEDAAVRIWETRTSKVRALGGAGRAGAGGASRAGRVGAGILPPPLAQQHPAVSQHPRSACIHQTTQNSTQISLFGCCCFHRRTWPSLTGTRAASTASPSQRMGACVCGCVYMLAALAGWLRGRAGLGVVPCCMPGRMGGQGLQGIGGVQRWDLRFSLLPGPSTS